MNSMSTSKSSKSASTTSRSTHSTLKSTSSRHESSKSSKSVTKSKSKLSDEDIKAAAINMLYPRNCTSFQILSHDLKKLHGPFRLALEYSLIVDNCKQQFTSTFFTKRIPNSIEKQRLFNREITFYRYIGPMLKHVMVQTMQSPVPQSFLARGCCDEPKHRNPSIPVNRGPPDPGCNPVCGEPLLMLQDLKQEGFKKIDIKEMDYQHCAAAVKALATFHALSAVVDRTDPKLKKSSYLKTAFPFLVPERGMFENMEKLFDDGMKIIAEVGPYMKPEILLPEKYVPKVVNFMHRKLHSILEEILKPHETQLNTLCHTNCLNSNNFLVLRDPKNRILSCKLIGLNQVRYCRPSVDLSLLLYSAANQDVRTSKINLLLELYRETFNKTLTLSQKKHHPTLPPSTGLISADQLQESMIQTKILGVALRAMTVAKEALDTNSENLQKHAIKEFKRNSQYNNRLTEAVSNLLEATERYAGDCSLSTIHNACPHYLPKKIIVPIDRKQKVIRRQKSEFY